MNCPGCYEEISELSEFCPHCHVRVKGDMRCAQCKTVLAPNATSCASCGSKKSEPRVFLNMPKSSSQITHHMAELVTEPKKKSPQRLGRRKYRTGARPIGWSNIVFVIASAASYLALTIFQVPHVETHLSTTVPQYTYWRLIKMDGSWTVIPPSPRLLLALFMVIGVAAVLQRVIRWSPISFMVQIICALVVLVTMVDAISRARDSLINVRSPYVVVFGAFVLIVLPWRHLERYDFTPPRSATASPDDAAPRGVNLRAKNTLVAGIAAALSAVALAGTAQAINAALPAKSTTPFTAGASVNALLFASSGVAQFNAVSGGRLLSYGAGEYGISSPTGVASDGTHIWVANANSNSLTEFIARSGNVVRVIADQRYALNNPVDVVSNGRYVFVLNSRNNSITQIRASSGELVRVISGATYQMNSPVAEELAGSRLWVSSPSSNLVTIINATTGVLDTVVTSVSSPSLMAPQGSDMWVASTGATVVRVNSRTLQITGRVTLGSSTVGPSAMASSGNFLYITDPTHSAVWQFNMVTESLTRTVQGDPYGFTTPLAVTVLGNRVMVVNAKGGLVTLVEFSTFNAALIRRIDVANVPYPGFASITYANGRLWVTY